MRNKWILIILLAFSSLVLAGCQASASAAPPPAAPATPAGMIVQGHIEPIRYTELSFLNAGQVVEVLVTEGETVQAGQVIARLAGKEMVLADLAFAEQEVLEAEQALADLRAAAYPAKEQARAALVDAEQAVRAAEEQLDNLKKDSTDQIDIDQSEAQVSLAKANLWNARERYQGLKNGIDPNQEAVLTARLNTAQTSLSRAQYALDNLELRAPSDGVITSLMISPGQFAPAGQPAATLADFSKWVAKTDDLTELEVVSVEAGQSVSMILDAFADAPMTGKVVRVAGQHEEKRGDVTYTVTIEMDRPHPSMRWGMTGQIIFEPGK